MITEESWLTDPKNTVDWKIREDVTAEAEIPGASPSTRHGLPQDTLCKLCHRVGNWRLMALLKESPTLKKERHKFPYEWFKVDKATTALNLTDIKSVDDRFDASTVYEVCINCCGQGFHDDQDHFWTKDTAGDSFSTSGWRSTIFDCRFSGSMDKALKKFEKMIANLRGRAEQSPNEPRI